jgi:ATP-dependent helicase/nuclease subunit A
MVDSIHHAFDPGRRELYSGVAGTDPRNFFASETVAEMQLPFVGSPDMLSLGEAVHAIFAADHAEAILERWGVHQVKAQDVLDACDRLSAHLSGLWPTGRLHRETPVFARLGVQLVSGRIDLLAEHEAGFAVIDHKSFPGSRDTWDARAVGYGPQLGLYAEALEVATARVCDALYIHMPIVGALLRVARQPGGTA